MSYSTIATGTRALGACGPGVQGACTPFLESWWVSAEMAAVEVEPGGKTCREKRKGLSPPPFTEASQYVPQGQRILST